METIVIYSPKKSLRLDYVLAWLLKERLQLGYKVIDDEAVAAKLPFVISYGKSLPNSISIPDSGLLWQKGVQPQEVATGKWHDIPTLFAIDEKGFNVPFDMFSAIFFLLSRYEEYYPYKPDKHGRYPATNSILCKKGWILRPLIDEWIYRSRKQLQAALKINIPGTAFVHQPTYDIDMAYSYLHKGAARIAGAYMRAILKIDFKQVSERTQVLKKKQKDPYDSFRWLRQLHNEYGCKPVYFVLAAHKASGYDKNIHPQHPAMMRVIKNLAKEGIVGIHPSYYSSQGDMLAEEKKTMEQVAGHKILISRQHYIRLKMPDTYRLLLKNGITEDYSMGYGAKLGFRAGTGSSFPWYDIENEAVAPLRIHPFCFMDTTAKYETGLPVSEAFDALEGMSRILEKTGGTLVTVFHNFSLGTSSEWKGWRQAYENFLQEKSQKIHEEARTMV